MHNPAIRAVITQAAYNMQTDARVSHAVHKRDTVNYKMSTTTTTAPKYLSTNNGLGPMAC